MMTLTKEEVEDKIELIIDSDTGSDCTALIDELLAHDAEQRQIIDEQVEENRGLRSDVLLTQAANAEQRQRIEELEQQNAALREALDWGGLRVSDEQVSQALKELGQTGTRAESYIKAVVEYAVHMRAKASQALKECR